MRHPALIPLSHQHHDALVAARRARRAADDEPARRIEAARAFVVFIEGRVTAHFREEEERLFLLLLAEGDPPPEELVRALLDHVRLHALATRLRRALEAGVVDPQSLREPGELLESHVRLEERELFPLIEQRVADQLESALAPAPPTGPDDDVGKPVDLARALRGAGPQWGMQSEELNATLLAWPAGHGVSAHGNSERDVLVIVLEGSAAVLLDGVEHELATNELLLLPKGSERSLSAGPDGVRYLSIHLRRGPLLPTPRTMA